MNLQPTQQDVARLAGVNKSTVSRVLRGDFVVAAATRERVLEAVEKLNYTLDPALSRIAAVRWQKYRTRAGEALAFVEATRAPINDRFFAGAEEQARPLGYALKRFCQEDFRGGVSVGAVLRTRAIKQVVLAGFQTQASLDGFPTQDFLTVHCGPTVPGVPIGTAMIDFTEALSTLWARAMRRGLRRIGLVQLIGQNQLYSDLQVQGVFRCWESSHPDRAISAVCELPADPACRVEAMGTLKAWVAEHQPDLVIGSHDIINAMLASTTGPGMRQPEFVSLAREDTTGAIAGFAEGARDLGALAVRLLHLNYLAGSQLAPSNTNSLAEPVWREGRSFERVCAVPA